MLETSVRPLGVSATCIVYHIHESLVQKYQPVLYWLEDDEGYDLKRSFVREKL